MKLTTDDEVWHPVTAYGVGIGTGLGILNRDKITSSGSTNSISTSSSLGDELIRKLFSR